MSESDLPAVDALTASGGRLYWIEGRRDGDVLVCWSDGRHRDVLPAGMCVASSVHEYGGGAYRVHGGTIWFVHAADQRIWRSDGSAVAPVTSESMDVERRHGDLEVGPDGRLLVCVRERHHGAHVSNELVSMPSDGSGESRVLAAGADFYSAPQLSPDGSQLAWISWDAPLMPWDGCQLWVARLRRDGSVGEPTLVAGGSHESVSQPLWSPDGVLYFLSDRSGWWSLHRDRNGRPETILALDAELGPAPWEFGYASYRFLPDRRIAVTIQRGPRDWLAVVPSYGGSAKPLALPYTSIKPYLAVDGHRLVIVASHTDHTPAVVLVDPDTGCHEQLSHSAPGDCATAYEPIDFPTRDGAGAHGVWYPALLHRADSTAPAPLLVRVHPGPTANSRLRLDPWITFFTGHGFAVLDVDYRGSTGYGRVYRNALRGRWGELDVTDCVDAVEHLADIGRIDPNRVAICGSSAGGYTALRALATTSVFAAASVRHAVIDPGTWRRSAPKFQAHHTDLLIGPATDTATYRDRSVFAHAHRITAPVLIVHGERDTVTPPAEAHRLAAVLGDRATLLTFADEAHGLRHPEHVDRVRRAELEHFRRAGLARY